MTTHNPSSRKRQRRHWYFIYSDFCVLCMRTETERERRYTPRPKRWEDRHALTESACSGHVL
jgi:hypothetical protein